MRQLRSRLPVGSPRWAVRLAQWHALGLADEDLDKPNIAIVNSSSELAICYSHLDEVARRLKPIIRAAGAVPFEIRTTAPSDFITAVGGHGGYILSSRDLISFDIEAMVEGAMLDGMICLSSCDKTLPGHLMAAARLDIPTLILPCGYQPSGCCRGMPVDIEEVFISSVQGTVAGDGTDLDHLVEMAHAAIQGPGVCSGLGTANTMHMVAEALGMALSGTTPVQANSTRLWETVERAGRRVVELVLEDQRPGRILSPGSFRNAATLLLATGGSLNAVKHLQAVAEAGSIDVDVFDLLSDLYDRVPLLVEVRPNGTTTIEELEQAGGAAGCLQRLTSLLDTEARTVEGASLGDLLARSGPSEGSSCIAPLDAPLRRQSTLMPVTGTLAPGGALVRSTAWVQERSGEPFRGRAMVFDDQEQVVDAVRHGQIPPGTVVVLRGIGPRGQAGMGMASFAAFALARAELVSTVALITDGQISGLVNQGLVVAEVTPEAVIPDSPLGRVEDGDSISVDLSARRVDLLVEDDVLRQRPGYQRSGAPVRGWLGVYARLVGDLRKGNIVES